MTDPRIQEAAAWWNQGTDEVHEMSHWRGEGGWTKVRWKAHGEKHVEMWKRFSEQEREVVMPFESMTMVEWGVGGGANVAAFAPYCKRIYGIDVSVRNLSESLDRMPDGSGKYTTMLISSKRSEFQTGLSDIDFFLSTMTFQHFPSKEYGVRVVKVAHDLLKPGGWALIQIRYVYDSSNVPESETDEPYSWSTNVAWSIAEFMSMCQAMSFEPRRTEIETGPSYAYFHLVRK